MNKSKTLIFVTAFATAPFFSLLDAREPAAADAPGSMEPPRLTPDERRAQWREFRNRPPEERNEQFDQWRRSRAPRDRGTEEPIVPGPRPERYLEQLEFRAILEFGGVTEFSLRNPYDDRTLVVSEGEPRHGIEVLEFDASRNALTLLHDGDTHTLYLHASKVGELANAQVDLDARRQEWEARREAFRQFFEVWSEAVENSPELKEMEEQFRELISDMRQNRYALRDLDTDSPEYEALRARGQEMGEEFRLLTEYCLLEARGNPAFEEYDIESFERMLRGVIIRRAGGGEGRRGPR